MKTGNDFYDKLPKEEQEQYTILFEDKSGWYTEDGNGEKDWSGSEDKIKQFDESCNKFIKLQNNPIYLSFLHFPSVDIKNYNFEKNREIIFCNSIFYGEIDFHSGFTKYIQETNFENAIFKEKVDFGEYTFGHKISFKSTTFKKDVNFKLSNFTRYINFRSTTFNKDVNFDEANFENKVSFWGAIFADEAHFDSTVFKQAFNFTKTQITNITFVNSDIKNGNFLYISAYNKDNPKNPKPLTKGNLKNKESARLIKDHFEKQNNIIEANKYFRIEQDKYLEELINDGYWKNKGDIAVVFLNKIIS
ncbi:MAG: pentapeptide repeat-containing protein [Sulfurovaceae bacterium]